MMSQGERESSERVGCNRSARADDEGLRTEALADRLPTTDRRRCPHLYGGATFGRTRLQTRMDRGLTMMTTVGHLRGQVAERSATKRDMSKSVKVANFAAKIASAWTSSDKRLYYARHRPTLSLSLSLSPSLSLPYERRWPQTRLATFVAISAGLSPSVPFAAENLDSRQTTHSGGRSLWRGHVKPRASGSIGGGMLANPSWFFKFGLTIRRALQDIFQESYRR
jgi:hypothetical protein